MAAAKAVSMLGNTLLLGPEATESAFKKQPLGRYQVLHLAVHALANTAQPDRAALVMLSDPAAGEDGFLQASEVVHLKLNADMAVLSACDTAIGPIGGEEGIATLSRAFLLAGTRTVVSTLWSIEDLSSLVLMRQFYAHLAAQMPADVALAEAKRDVIRKFGRKAQPYYWAAFTLEGAGDQTVLRHPRKT
jgi:CHAT domain-containing protein